MSDDDDRVDGRELRPLNEPGSDERLSDEVLARISAPRERDEEEEEED